MRYEESQPKIFHIILLIIVFILIFSPWYLNLRELIGTEGKFGSMAIDMNILNPSNFAHGESLSSVYPLYPWLVSIFYKLGFNIEYALRGVSVLALAGTSVIIFETTRRVSDLQSAFVASCFMFSNIFVLEKAIDGNPFTLTVLLLLSGWILWYYCGIIKGNWNLGWICSLFFAGMAFYTIGWTAIVYFFIPLIFMRRPLTLWNKLKFPGFTVGICLVVVFILLWMIPQISNSINSPFYTPSLLNDVSNTYFRDLIFYPFNIFGGFMPWAVLAWPAFCVAFYPLDKNPIFSRFLRIIFFSLFFILWINPFSTTRDFIILVPPVAILTGTNYWLLVRRHGNGLQKIFHYLTVVLLLLNIGGLILLLSPVNFWTDYFPFTWLHKEYFERGVAFFNKYLLFGVIQSAIGIALGFALLILRKKRTPLWFRAVSLGLMFMMFFWSITYPYRSQDNDAKSTAELINTAIAKDIKTKYPVIYKSPHIADIYILSCYVNGRLLKIYDFNQLPVNKEKVYVFTLTTPIYPSRVWTKLAKVKYKEKFLYLWKGVLVDSKTFSENLNTEYNNI